MGYQDSTSKRAAPRRHELPIARERRVELETCAYCPRLCRAVCPVSNAEPREALIPWGKMGSLLHTDLSAPREEPWGCTGCGACTSLCRHDNPVADVLVEGRADVFAADRAPPAAVRIAREHPGRLLRQAAQLEELGRRVSADPTASTALLLGCPTLRGADAEAVSLLEGARLLAGRPLRLVSECCGLVPSLAGDAPGARLAQDRLLRALHGVERLVVADPGCAKGVETLLSRHRLRARKLERTSYLAWAAGQAARLRSVARPGGRYGWQPPCWARGTAAEPAARVLLERLVGPYVEIGPGCSGGGGLVPSVFPAASRRIGEERVRAFREAGVNIVVVGCASSARRLRSSGTSDIEVVQLAALVREGLEER